MYLPTKLDFEVFFYIQKLKRRDCEVFFCFEKLLKTACHGILGSKYT